MAAKMRIAWFSPLNCGDTPSASVSAYVSDQLLPLLKDRFEIELFHDSFLEYPGFRTANFLSAYRRHQEAPFDCFFYQLEDSRVSAFVRAHLALLPGVVLFHDFILSDDGPEPILNSPWKDVIARFHNSGHAWPARDAEHQAQRPYALREAAFAVLPLFSSVRWASEYMAHCRTRLVDPPASSRAAYLPLPADYAPRGPTSEGLRIASSATVRIEGRMHLMLEALSKLDQPWQLTWLVAQSEQAAAERMLQEYELEGVTIVAQRSPARWRELLAACDVAFHLHFSVYGQVGPYLELSLASGVAVMVSQFGATESLGSEVAWKILPGEREGREILAVLERLAADRSLCQNNIAKIYATEFFTPKVVAQDLTTVLLNARKALLEFRNKWGSFEQQARTDLVTEVRALIGHTDLLPDPFAASFSELGFM